MKRKYLFLGLFASLALAGCSSVGENTDVKECDTDIIVECQQPLGNMTKEQITKSQNTVLNNIYMLGGINYKILDRFDTLNNAVVISVNSQDVEAVKSIPGVKSVTMNKLHWVRAANCNDGAVPLTENPGPSVDENISATTMNKPTDTNDGEGTVIAILDNEFYFKGASSATANDAWFHEVYTPLDDDVAVRFTYDNLTTVVSSTNAKRKSATKYPAGVEGSLYFNNKVPFYYDYGGTAKVYGNDEKCVSDYDVSSEISYHGSHVSSLAAANAPTYKGIAPKAQLACMKVFSEFKADETAEGLGFGDYSGAYDRWILKGLEDCIKLKVDGINMSLGSDLDDFDSESITLKTLSQLAESGILTSISAGNSGKASYSFAGAYGNWTKDMVETGIMSSYANNKASMTIASGQPTQVYYENALHLSDGKYVAFEDQVVNREGFTADFDEEHKLVDLITNPDSSLDTQKDLEYVYTGKFGSSGDYNSIDVDGKIVIVNRGSTSFEDKVNQAVTAGAKALIIINNDPTASSFNFRCSFGDLEPSIPVALLLFKDKNYFDNHSEGSFKLISKMAATNETPYTLSTFTTDGATYNYDLKPEITSPGESIRGAVPPQKKEDKINTPYNTYEYLSGTSMAAPNYAGAQSVVLSEKAAPIYRNAKANSTTVTAAELAEIETYRKTVDMRLMSTADPMFDINECPEQSADAIYVDQANKKNYSSPRLQGAGMVNLGDALATDTYLEGYDSDGQLNRKSKISLFNNAEIAKGNVEAKFVGHNESAEARTYNVKITVMKPAIALNNDIITSPYVDKGTADSIKAIPGFKYWKLDEEVTNTSVKANVNDVIKVTKPIDYWLTQAEWDQDHDAAGNENKNKVANHTFEVSNYVCTNATAGQVTWEKLPSKEYQSVQDTVIAKDASLGQITLPANASTPVTLPKFSLTDAQKQEILADFPYGCAIEGFITLTSTQGKVDLGMPFLGFYSGTDINDSASYETAPVVEEFEFEKDATRVYPSDLANNIAKTLVGKDNAEMGSVWVTGYAAEMDNINTDKVLTNDLAWNQLSGFRSVGCDVRTKKQYANAKDNIYVGNPESSNTMVIQQFVLRSVSDNYFEIKNKNTGKTVYKSVLEDMLFGDQGGKYPLYKSHVEAGYLSGGYVCHRAYAIIPLYDTETNVAFDSGEYTITFNYLLAATGNWVNKQYDFHVDSTNPEITSISKADGKVRIDVNEANADYGKIGYSRYDLYKDSTTGNAYFEVDEQEFNDEISASNEGLDTNRMYVGAYDKAGGYSGAIIKADENFQNYYILQNPEITVTMDFEVSNGKAIVYVYDIDGNKTRYRLTKAYKLSKYQGKTLVSSKILIDDDIVDTSADTTNKGCGSSVTASGLVGLLALSFLGGLTLKKRKEN